MHQICPTLKLTLILANELALIELHIHYRKSLLEFIFPLDQ